MILVLRVIRFGLVGVLCLIIQILFLNLFKHITYPAFANVIGFVLSAQVNFMLSYYFTWHDSQRHRGYGLVSIWVKFNAVVLMAACINGVAFDSLQRYTFVRADEAAAVGATVISTIVTFCINHFFLLKPLRIQDETTTGNSNVPARME